MMCRCIDKMPAPLVTPDKLSKWKLLQDRKTLINNINHNRRGHLRPLEITGFKRETWNVGWPNQPQMDQWIVEKLYLIPLLKGGQKKIIILSVQEGKLVQGPDVDWPAVGSRELNEIKLHEPSSWEHGKTWDAPGQREPLLHASEWEKVVAGNHYRPLIGTGLWQSWWGSYSIQVNCSSQEAGCLAQQLQKIDWLDQISNT